MNKWAVLAISMVLFVPLAEVDVYGDSAGDYWPAWRGPDATGVAPKSNPPVTWSETENIKWKVKLPGQGTSSPVIWGNKIFFLTAIETGKKGTPSPDSAAQNSRRIFHGGKAPKNIYKFDIVCLDRKTGKTLWQKTACEKVPHEGHHPNHGFASYSPVTDGKYVWASFGSRGTHCYDIDGKHIWSRDLGRMRSKVMFGEGASPALIGDTLIVVMDQEDDSFIYALNKQTGETLWKKPRDEATSWATPIGVHANGKIQVITSATAFIRSYDLKSGELIWQCSGQTGNVIPSPATGFGMVFCTSGFRGNALQAIELGKTGKLNGTDAIKWQINEPTTPYVPSPLLYGDKLYVCYGNRAVLSCYDARTGKANFVKQTLGEMKGIYASPVGAADRVYFIGRDGKAQVIKNSDKFEPLAANSLDDEFDASPAIVGDELFLKGKENLYCISR